MTKHPFFKSRTVLMVAVAATLASCSTVQEADRVSQVTGSGPVAVRTISPSRDAFSTPSVVTDKSAGQYFKDLESCRAYAARKLGSAGADDDVAALKRALLANEITGSTLDVGYVSTDPAMKRDYLVRTCISRKGYRLQQ